MRETGHTRVEGTQVSGRVAVRFASGRDECAAWHYPGANGACVIMTGGFAVTKEPGTDRFARRFHEAGFGVLAFDYRRIGQSSGRPRQVLPLRDQLADWRAAIAFAGTLPDVDPARIALWAFSASGGHVLRVAAQGAPVAAVIAQTPNADGPAASRNAARHQTPAAMLRFTGLMLADTLGGLFGRAPILVPLGGRPGTVALLTTPDSADTGRALNPGDRYPQWQQVVAARSAAALMFYRPGRDAPQIRCPLLVVACEQDQSALFAPGVRAAEAAPRGELVALPGGHYAPFLDAHEAAVAAQLAFLRRHLTPEAAASH